MIGEEQQRQQKSFLREQGRQITWLVILIIVFFAFIALVPLESPAKDGKASVSFNAVAGNITILDKTIEVDKGTNAFNAMQMVAEVQYTDYAGMGAMVEAINSIRPGENEFWKLIVNGEEAAVGISSIVIEEDTEIEWKIESFEDYTG